MKKIKFGKAFKISYFAFVGVLAILVALALMHVNSVLEQYENEHPQRHLEKAVELLAKEAEDGTLWKKEGVPSMEKGVFEQNTDPKADFVKKIKGEVKFTSPKWIDENKCTYGVMSDGFTFAEITLAKKGPVITKLAIISIQEYELVSYKPVSHTYTLKLPEDVKLGEDLFLKINGTDVPLEMGETNKEGESVITLKDLYSKPDVEIKDKSNNKANYRLPDSNKGEIEFDNTIYTLTLPESMKVEVDGSEFAGTETDDGRLSYRIRLAKKAEVKLYDGYGNTVNYQGASNVPLTYYSLKTEKECKISVDGAPVSETLSKPVEMPELEVLRPYVKEFPEYVVTEIAVLKNDAVIKVTDKDGNEVPFNKEEKIQDITKIATNVLETIPEELSKEVNPLKILEDWSLFMTCDLNFNSLSKHLIKGSDVYTVAHKYNNSIERNKFINVHTLRKPPFIEESITNFVQITEDSFVCDVHFIKQMNVSGKKIDDEMEERCYFVKYNGQWKLIGMKEIVDNAE